MSDKKVILAMIESKQPNAYSRAKSESETDQKKLPRLNSNDLMKGSKEIVIEHDGKDYRLRVTALGKLILTR